MIANAWKVFVRIKKKLVAMVLYGGNWHRERRRDLIFTIVLFTYFGLCNIDALPIQKVKEVDNFLNL